MITEDRLNHIIGVARKAYKLAEKIKPGDENYAREMFIMGFLHDIGYEFLPSGKGHAALAGELLQTSGYKYYKEIANHGYHKLTDVSDELFILNAADMTTDVHGHDCSLSERLDDIAFRYGNQSDAYLGAALEMQQLQQDCRFLLIEPLLKK